MSLRGLIEAKERWTGKLPILVGNPSAAAAEVQTFRIALATVVGQMAEKKAAGKRVTKAEREKEDRLRAQLQEAQERQAATVVQVDVQSLPEDEWEAALAHLNDEDRENYELNDILGALLAASCVDPELQDADWWQQQLSGPAWTDGDKAAISQGLLQLNVFAPRFDALGKG